MPRMKIRSKVAVTTQIPIATMEKVDKELEGNNL